TARADPRVPGVLALRHRGEHQARRKGAGDVLEAVHREICPAIEQRRLDLLHEESLAADARQRAVQNAVAFGGQLDQRHLESGPRGREQARHVVRLPEREWALAGRDAERHQPSPALRGAPSSPNSSAAASASSLSPAWTARSLAVGWWSILFTMAAVMASMTFACSGLSGAVRLAMARSSSERRICSARARSCASTGTCSRTARCRMYRATSSATSTSARAAAALRAAWFWLMTLWMSSTSNA